MRRMFLLEVAVAKMVKCFTFNINTVRGRKHDKKRLAQKYLKSDDKE